MRKCMVCGKTVKGCTRKENWRNIACSPEHYLEHVNRKEGASGNVKHKLVAFDGKSTWNISSYDVGLHDIEMIATNGKKLSLKDTEYIIIMNDEKQYLLKSFFDNGKYLKVKKDEYGLLLKFKEPVVTKPAVIDDETGSDIEEASQTYNIDEIPQPKPRKPRKRRELKVEVDEDNETE